MPPLKSRFSTPPTAIAFSIEDSLRFLSDAGRILGESLELEATIENVVRLVVPGLSDWCAVHLVSHSGSIDRIAVMHIQPEKVMLARELQSRYPVRMHAPNGIAKVIRTGETEMFEEIPDSILEKVAQDHEHLSLLRSLGLKSSMIVPLKARGKILGTMTFVMAESGRHYCNVDLVLAEELSNRVAVAVDNARLLMETQEQAKTLDAIFSAVSDFILLYDSEGRFTHINEAGAKAMAKSQREVIGRTSLEVGWTPHLAEKIESNRRKVMETARPVRDEVISERQGAKQYFEYTFWPIPGKSGRPQGVVGITRDITERRRTEEALRSSESQYRALAENLPHLVWMNNADGSPRFFNRRWAEYTGREVTAKTGALNKEIIHPEDLPRIMDLRSHSISTETPYSIEVRILHFSNEYRWHLARVVPVRDSEGRVESWSGTATDIHELRTAGPSFFPNSKKPPVT